MVLKSYTKFLVALFVMFSGMAAYAQSTVLSANVRRAQNEGIYFQPVTLFQNATGAKHATLKNENLLHADRAAIESFYSQKPQAVAMELTDKNTGKSYKLQMMRSNPVAKDANFGTIENGFRFRGATGDGLHYQGAVEGTNRSLATMSVFADGTVMMLFANDEGNFIVGMLEDGSGNYIFYNDKDMLNRPASPCAVKDDTYTNPDNGSGHSKTSGVNMCRKVQVYWECDFQYFTSKSSNITTARNYMTGLFNQFQAMYTNDNISVELKSLYIWTTNDAYPGSTSTLGLNIFKGYWNGRGDDFDGDLAHFITRDGGNNGGLAYVDILGNRNFAYAYSEIHGTFNSIPTFSWDVEVLTHETGHNLGSKHTHWCGWNTGTSGGCGSIDNCASQENGSSCTTCPKTWDNALPAASWTGTVMSYCHLVSRGINLANGFGPLPNALLRTKVTNAASLKPVISAVLTPTSICSGNGSITVGFAPDNFGVAPYTYSWNTGANSQDLTGISTPGNYLVSITDANGCTNAFDADVTLYAKPGDASATGYVRPVCCNDSAVTISLNATVPVNLSTCQTVAWLRTTMSLGTYAAAQNAFAVATAADIIASTNTAGINNTTAAMLNVASPTPCGAQTYYYTPFVTRKARPANNFTVSGTTTTLVTQGSTTIGAATVLADQTLLPAPCDMYDTVTAASISVTVTNYTGRAGKMSLLLVNGSNVVIYRAEGLAGNGTYTVPLAGLGNPLDAMEIQVFDFNCSAPTACTGSSASIAVTRTVTYPAVTQITFDRSCVVGQSVMLGFAPVDCEVKGTGNGGGGTHVGNAVVGASLHVYPNPATKSVNVQFIAANSGKAVIKVADMLGKVVTVRDAAYSKGDNLVQIDVQGWAKGVYSLSFTDSETPAQNIKLIVE